MLHFLHKGKGFINGSNKMRRTETIKVGGELVGNRTRIKVVKNKLAPPFKVAEFDIIYGRGVSRTGSLIDLGAEHGVIVKSGSWYSYMGERIGQGRENAKQYLADNPDVAAEVEEKIRQILSGAPGMDED